MRNGEFPALLVPRYAFLLLFQFFFFCFALFFFHFFQNVNNFAAVICAAILANRVG